MAKKSVLKSLAIVFLALSSFTIATPLTFGTVGYNLTGNPDSALPSGATLSGESGGLQLRADQPLQDANANTVKTLETGATTKTDSSPLSPGLLQADSGSASKNVKDATSVSGCISQPIGSTGVWATPSNCLFLEEPIGGKPGVDLYYVSCQKEGTGDKAKTICKTLTYNAGQIIDPKTMRGPIQAILTRNAGKASEGSFGLLFGYLRLIYNYMSGIIIGISVLFVVVGGIQISTAGGDGVEKGINRIKQAITGLILWFTASLILYTINPTFFTL